MRDGPTPCPPRCGEGEDLSPTVVGEGSWHLPWREEECQGINTQDSALSTQNSTVLSPASSGLRTQVSGLRAALNIKEA